MIIFSLLDQDYRFLTQIEDHFEHEESFKIDYLGMSLKGVASSLAKGISILVIGEVNLEKDVELNMISNWKEKYPDILFVKAIALNDDIDQIAYLSNGCNGVIFKDESLVQFIYALECCIKYQVYLNPLLSKLMIDKLRIKTSRKVANSLKLKKRSLEVMKLLVDGYSYIQMADELETSVDVIRYYIKDIYKTFGVNNKIEAINKYLGKDTLELV